jgi:hypothetical protein
MTVMEALISELGLRGAIRLTTWLLAWSMVLEESKREPTIELMEELGYSESTHYRRLAEFRQVFPTQKSPTVLLVEARERLGRQKMTQRRLGGLQVDALIG